MFVISKSRCWMVLVAAVMAGSAVAARAQLVWQCDIAELQKSTPELKHSADGRLPIITWPPFGDERGSAAFNEGKPLTAEAFRAIKLRGMTQRIPFRPQFIPMAKAIEAAGLPIVFMEG